MSDYTGRDNLEVMKEACNYNGTLTRLVRDFARPDDTVLDFGAGCGTFARPLKQAGFNVLAVEPDDVLRAALCDEGISTGASLSERDAACVDTLYSLNVLEHIRDDEEALREIHRVLRPGGRVLIYVPAFQVLYSGMDAKVGHVRRYRRDDLVRKMWHAGFAVNDARYVDSIGFFVSLVFKWLDNGAGDINPRMLRYYDRYLFPVSLLADRVLHPFFGKNLLVLATVPPVKLSTTPA